MVTFGKCYEIMLERPCATSCSSGWAKGTERALAEHFGFWGFGFGLALKLCCTLGLMAFLHKFLPPVDRSRYAGHGVTAFAAMPLQRIPRTAMCAAARFLPSIAAAMGRVKDEL